MTARDRTAEMSPESGPDPTTYRRLLGNFATGVTVVAGMAGETPVGFACQSFTALSLEPPLVLFCPAKSSRTWPLIRQAGSFTVNVLSHDQSEVSARFGRPGADKFDGLSWFRAPSGAPVLPDVLCWLDCSVRETFDAGDHVIVTGEVTAFEQPAAQRPLLFFRGAYAGIERPQPSADILSNLITWTQHYDRNEVWM